MTSLLSRPAGAALAVAALAGAMLVQSARDRWYPRVESIRTGVLYVRSPAAMQRLAFGFRALAADLYWVRAIQHFGGARLETGPDTAGQRYALLYPLLDIATTLDPWFNIAYRFGAIFLGEPPPGGPGRPDQAIALLRKAVVAMPLKWQYYYDVGFVYYWRLRDYKTASEWFQRAAEQPDAPNWLPSLAASMLTRSDDRATARAMWQRLLQSEQDWIRRTADRSLLQIDALDQIDRLDEAIRRVGPDPDGRFSWAFLASRTRLRQVPIDPAQTPYDLDPATGRVRVASTSPLFPMPDETGGGQ